jgi:2-polyprenyl-3-methyl-5-hydroxy-6-metoxy-1,4-benzoquinol methylase
LKGGHSRRPEIAGAIMYGEQEVLKYIKNERNAAIQSDMTKYALKLLKYSAYKNKSETFLDIGCGCGISSHIIESSSLVYF